jgi:hypothetical protein
MAEKKSKIKLESIFSFAYRAANLAGKPLLSEVPIWPTFRKLPLVSELPIWPTNKNYLTAKAARESLLCAEFLRAQSVELKRSLCTIFFQKIVSKAAILIAFAAP